MCESDQVSSTMDLNLIDSVDNLLNDQNYEGALDFVKQRSQEEFHINGLDLISVVCKHLINGDKLCPQNTCEEILIELAKCGNAKEVLIGLLEQVEGERDDFKFKALLNPIQIVLKRLPSKRGKSLEWVMNALYTHVSLLSLPKPCNFEGEERKLLDLQPETQRISDVTSCLIDFYRPFVEEISLTVESNLAKKEADRRRHSLKYFLLQLLDHPLAYVDLSHKIGDAESTLRVTATKIVVNIKHLESNFYKLFTFNSQMDPDDDKISDLSLANFFYLVFAEQIENYHLPCVYTHLYLVESCLPFVNALLKRMEECVTHKGILLSSFLMKKIEFKELGVSMLDSTQYIMLAQNLINVMLHSSVKELRFEAVTLLRQYINKYDLPSRYQLIKCLLNFNEHSGVQGLLIQGFKNNLNEALAMQPVSPYFIGPNLTAIMSVITRLAEGVETDVLDQSDRLLETLNLIRFLALRDPPQVNVTGFWSLVTDLEKDFLKPLRQCLDFSRAHYQLELKCQKDEVKKSARKKRFPIPKQHSEQVLKLALNTFDVIESITGRIEELINLGTK